MLPARFMSLLGIASDAVVHEKSYNDQVLWFRCASKPKSNAWDLALGWGLPLKALELLLGA